MAWMLAGLLLAGCTASPRGEHEAASWPAYWTPHRLFLAAEPYEALHVEIDAVEGAEPSEAELASLHAFLERHCDKPAGIVFVQNPLIDRAAASEAGHRWGLAGRYMHGPPREQKGQTAYLYLLYYDSSVWNAEAVIPHVNLDRYPAAVWIDRAYKPRLARDIQYRVLLHEVGHILGLARHPDNAQVMHCPDRDCLMAETMRVSLLRHLLRMGPGSRHRDLCADCLETLDRERAAPASAERFFGPWLVRYEEGYYVATLPTIQMLVIGPMHFVEMARAREAMRDSSTHILSRGVARTEDEAELRLVLERAMVDEAPYVRELAQIIEQNLNEQAD